MRYNTHSSKETVGRYPDGGSSCRTFYHPTIGTQNMATTYDSTVIPSGIDEVSVKSEERSVKSGFYNLQGQRINGLQKGLNILDGKKILIK